MNGITPTPWKREGRTIYALMHAGWKKGVEQFQNRFCCSIQGGPGVSEEEMEANARLFLESPELADCLEDALDVIGSWGEDGDPAWAQRARECLARIRGESEENRSADPASS